MLAGCAAQGTDQGSAPPGVVQARDARPGEVATSPLPPPPPIPAPSVAISEIMYHPVLENDIENDDVENHEFVEIHNPGQAPVDLSGWTLGGTIKFVFPSGTRLIPGAYLAIAKNKQKLMALAPYQLTGDLVLGDFESQLDNGGGTVALQDAAGVVRDAVKYDDKFPWPVAADSLGVSEWFLPPRLLPETKHRYLGYSLERVSFTVAATDVANWVPSALDGATPGRVNGARRLETPPAIVESITITPLAPAPDEIPTIRVRTSAGRPLLSLAIEWFVDDVTRVDEKTATVPMVRDADMWAAALPGQPANSIVRYRFLALLKSGAAADVLSPRPSDPFSHHGYFVTPPVASKTRAYHLFVSPTDWGRMWTHVQPDANSGRVLGCKLGVLLGTTPDGMARPPEDPEGCPGNCKPNSNWNARVPGVFAFGGQIYDVRVRYQGSKVNRLNGKTVKAWPMAGFQGPTVGANPPPVLSWSVKFPRYAAFEGKGTVLLNKNTQACPGFPNRVGTRMSQMLGIPAPDIRFARMNVNGLYYNLAMEMERMDDDLLGRAWKGAVPGDLFKNDGLRWDEGPWSWGDGRLLQPGCGFTPAERMTYNLPRKNHEWRNHAALIKLHEDLEVARKAGGAALRRFLETSFDVPKMLDHIANVNWGGAWDDAFHNQFFYRRPDGIWMWLPWDFDNTLSCESATKCDNATRSFYLGQEGDPSNRNRMWNHWKDAFLRAFRPEYDARLRELSKTVFAPENIKGITDAIAATYDEDEAKASLGGVACGKADFQTRMQIFAEARIKTLGALKP